MHIFCCPNCEFVDIGNENEKLQCKRCGASMISLGVSSAEWNSFNNEQIRKTISNRIAEYKEKTVKHNEIQQIDLEGKTVGSELTNDKKIDEKLNRYVLEVYTSKYYALTVGWQIKDDELSSIDKLALTCLLSLDVQDIYKFLASNDVVKADVSLVCASLATNLLKSISYETGLELFEKRIISGLRILYDMSATNASKLYNNRIDHFCKTIKESTFEEFNNYVLDILEQEAISEEFKFIENTMPVYVSDCFDRFNHFAECSTFLKNIQDKMAQEMTTDIENNDEKKGDEKWGDGIPDYSENDLMTANDIQEVSVNAVYEYMVKEKYDIEAVYSDVDKIPSIVARKENDLYFVIIDSAVAPTIPELDKSRVNKYIDHASKFHAKLLYASVSIGSYNGERFEKGLALKNDGYYARFTGFQPIVYFENNIKTESIDVSPMPDDKGSPTDNDSDGKDIRLCLAEDPEKEPYYIIKNKLISCGLAHDKSYKESFVGATLWERTCIALEIPCNWIFETTRLAKSDDLMSYGKIVDILVPQMWNFFGLGVYVAKEEISKGTPFYEMNDKELYETLTTLFLAKRCFEYTLSVFDDKTREEICSCLSEILGEVYDKMLEFRNSDNIPFIFIDDHFQEDLLANNFIAGWSVYAYRHKRKGVLSNLFRGGSTVQNRKDDRQKKFETKHKQEIKKSNENHLQSKPTRSKIVNYSRTANIVDQLKAEYGEEFERVIAGWRYINELTAEDVDENLKKETGGLILKMIGSSLGESIAKRIMDLLKKYTYNELKETFERENIDIDKFELNMPDDEKLFDVVIAAKEKAVYLKCNKCGAYTRSTENYCSQCGVFFFPIRA